MTMVQQMKADDAGVATKPARQHPMSAAKQQWFEQEIKRLVQADSRAFVAGRSERTQRDRIEIVLQAYRDLWALGYRIEKPENLSPAHMAALVDLWRAKKLSRDTALVRWSRLRSWCVVIGKAGMAPDLGSLWGAGEPVDVVRAPTRSTETLTQEQYDYVLAELRAKGKETSYWLVRCVRELQLHREEAVLLRPAHAVTPEDEAVVVSMGKGTEQRTVVLDTPAKKALIAAVRDYVVARGRDRLGWPDMTLAAMTKKYSNQVAYQVRKRWGANTAQANSPAAEGMTAPSDEAALLPPSGVISPAAALAAPDSGAVRLGGARAVNAATNAL
jgi:hypothetical protein